MNESDHPVDAAHRRGRRQFAGVAERYATSASHASGDDLTWFERQSRLIGPGLALDVACGGGFSTRAMIQAGHDVVASDLTLESVAAARRATVSRARGWVAAPAERLPFRSGAFDLVGCRIAPHHFGDVEAFAREVDRVLRPGGALLLIDTTVPQDAATASWINDLERLRDPSHVVALSADGWREVLAGAGLLIGDMRAVRKRHELEPWLERAGCRGETAEEVRRRLREAPAAMAAAYRVELDDTGRPVAFTDTKLCIRALQPA